MDPCSCGYVPTSRIGKGIHYGYPLCCIEFYIQRSITYDLGLPISDEPRRLDGSGFIPCALHDQMTEPALTHLIQSGRTCPSPFDPSPLPEYAEVITS